MTNTWNHSELRGPNSGILFSETVNFFRKRRQIEDSLLDKTALLGCFHWFFFFQIQQIQTFALPMVCLLFELVQ